MMIKFVKFKKNVIIVLLFLIFKVWFVFLYREILKEKKIGKILILINIKIILKSY